MNGSAASRLAEPTRAAEIVRRWRQTGERVALVSGAFDLLTVEQVRALAEARSRADRLVVAVLGDHAAAAGGAGRPVLPARDRAALVAALRGVDLVVVLEGPAADAPARVLEPHSHVALAGGRDVVARVLVRRAEDG